MIRFTCQTIHHIYMLYCPETGLTKLGITDNPKRRIREIARDCAFEVELLAVWLVPEELARGYEAHLHGSFTYCRHHGEWFKLDRQERDELSSMPSLRFGAHQRRKDMREFSQSSLPANAFHVALMVGI